MPIVSLLRKEDVAIEKELAKFQAQAVTFPRANQELAAIRFYLHFALWECQQLWKNVHRGITNYLTLLREIERWRYEHSERVCLVTFNYDTMLEDALQQFQDSEIKSLDCYVSLGPYMVIKLHGSINWGFDVDENPEGYTPQRVIKEVGSLRITNSVRLVSAHPMVKQDGHLVFPAISIPVENKDEFACPQRHVEALAAVMPKVTRVLTVGWRATEARFLSMLQNRLMGLTGEAVLMIVSGDRKGAEETRANLNKANSNALIETGFTGLINNIAVLDTFLRTPPADGIHK